MELYYIIEGDEKNGPFDVVSMVRKIRNGKLEAHHMVLIDGQGTAVTANEIKVFHDYFMDMTFEEEQAAGVSPSASGELNVKELLCESWRDYEENQRTSLIVACGLGGLLVTSLLLTSLLPSALVLLLGGALMGALLFAYTLFAGLTATQWPGWLDFKHLLKQPNVQKLLGRAALNGLLCLGFPMLLWGFIGPICILVALIGYLLFASTLFAPLIWLENQSLSAGQCMRQSVSFLKSMDGKTARKAMLIQSLNFLSMLTLMFPLLISLPVVQFAWVSIYYRFSAPKQR